MSYKDLHFQYRLQENAGRIPPGMAARLAIVTMLESGLVAFHKGYYGRDEWKNTKKSVAEARRLSTREAQHQGTEIAGHLQEALLSDVRSLARLAEAHTSSDFAHILGDIRNRVVRDSYQVVTESPLMPFATSRTFTNFLPVKGLRFGGFDRLLKRPEGTNVQYATFGETEDLYTIANYELAFKYTWEMWVNDDVSVPQIAMEELGRAARRTRTLILLEAIKAGLARTTVGGSVGGPTIDRIDALKTLIASQKDGNKPLGLALTDIVVPVKWDSLAKVSVRSEKYRPAGGDEAANPAYEAAIPHQDRTMSEVFDEDWLGFDAESRPYEFGVLRGYEAGPQTRTKMPDVIETIDEGLFSDHSCHIKVSDNCGSKLTNAKGVVLVKGKN